MYDTPRIVAYRLCQIALKQTLRKFEKWYKFSSHLKAKLRKKRLDSSFKRWNRLPLGVSEKFGIFLFNNLNLVTLIALLNLF